MTLVTLMYTVRAIKPEELPLNHEAVFLSQGVPLRLNERMHETFATPLFMNIQ
jgi:hypothetical protein